MFSSSSLFHNTRFLDLAIETDNGTCGKRKIILEIPHAEPDLIKVNFLGICATVYDHISLSSSENTFLIKTSLFNVTSTLFSQCHYSGSQSIPGRLFLLFTRERAMAATCSLFYVVLRAFSFVRSLLLSLLCNSPEYKCKLDSLSADKFPILLYHLPLFDARMVCCF